MTDPHQVAPHSPEFLFGQILTRLHSGDQQLVNLTNEVANTNKAIADLPCNHHVDQIRLVKAWQEEHDRRLAEGRKRVFSWRQGLVIALSSTVVMAVLSFIFSLVLNNILTG